MNQNDWDDGWLVWQESERKLNEKKASDGPEADDLHDGELELPREAIVDDDNEEDPDWDVTSEDWDEDEDADH